MTPDCGADRRVDVEAVDRGVGGHRRVLHRRRARRREDGGRQVGHARVGQMARAGTAIRRRRRPCGRPTRPRPRPPDGGVRSRRRGGGRRPGRRGAAGREQDRRADHSRADVAGRTPSGGPAVGSQAHAESVGPRSPARRIRPAAAALTVGLRRTSGSHILQPYGCRICRSRSTWTRPGPIWSSARWPTGPGATSCAARWRARLSVSALARNYEMSVRPCRSTWPSSTAPASWPSAARDASSWSGPTSTPSARRPAAARPVRGAVARPHRPIHRVLDEHHRRSRDMSVTDIRKDPEQLTMTSSPSSTPRSTGPGSSGPTPQARALVGAAQLPGHLRGPRPDPRRPLQLLHDGSRRATSPAGGGGSWPSTHRTGSNSRTGSPTRTGSRPTACP